MLPSPWVTRTFRQCVHVIIGQMYFTVSDLLGDILSLKSDTKDLDQLLSLRVPKFAPPSSPTEVLDFRNRGAETNRLRIQSGRKANELTKPLEGVPKVTSGKLLTALPPIIPREGVGLLGKYIDKVQIKISGCPEPKNLNSNDVVKKRSQLK